VSEKHTLSVGCGVTDGEPTMTIDVNGQSIVLDLEKAERHLEAVEAAVCGLKLHDFAKRFFSLVVGGSKGGAGAAAKLLGAWAEYCADGLKGRERGELYKTTVLALWAVRAGLVSMEGAARDLGLDVSKLRDMEAGMVAIWTGGGADGVAGTFPGHRGKKGEA
jgi:hypothetical protein